MRTRTGRQVDPFGDGSYSVFSGMAGKKPQGPVPSFELNLVSGALSSAVTFSRASNATQFDSAGRLIWAPHQGCTRGNMLSGSWATSIGGDGTFVSGGTDNVTGQPSAVATWTAASPTSGLAAAPFSVVVGTNNTYSVYLRYVNCQWVRVALYSVAAAANQARIWVDLLNSVAGTSNAGGTATLLSASVVQVAGGWVRVTVSGNCAWTTATDGGLVVSSAIADGSPTRLGNGAAIELCAPQLEPTGVDSPKPWIPEYYTSGSAYYGPRFDYNPATLAPRGLLIEEQRTNSLTFSYDFTNAAWTKTNSTVGAAVASPDGLTNGRVLTATAANATMTAAVTTTAIAWDHSIWLRRVSGTGNIDITLDGTNWVTQTLTGTWTRFDVSQTGVAGTSNPGVRIVTSGDVIEAFGAQAEAGAFATSLIPTFGVAATRSGDVADLASAPPYTSTGMTYCAQFERQAIPPSGTSSAVWFFGDASTYVSGVFDSTTPVQQRTDLFNATVSQAQLSVASGVAGTVYKWAARLAPNDARMAQNGTLGTLDSTVSMPASLPATRLSLGKGDATNTQQMHGWLRGLQIYTSALTDAQLQALTA